MYIMAKGSTLWSSVAGSFFLSLSNMSFDNQEKIIGSNREVNI